MGSFGKRVYKYVALSKAEQSKLSNPSSTVKRPQSIETNSREELNRSRMKFCTILALLVPALAVFLGTGHTGANGEVDDFDKDAFPDDYNDPAA